MTIKNTLQLFIEKSKPLKLLYVEDEKTIREESRELFSKFFYSVDVAENGEDGLNLFKSHDYDIVITDINMPKMNGIDMSKEIKKISHNQEVLILSALEKIEYAIDAINMGINGVIQKPIDMSALIDILSESVDRVITRTPSKVELIVSNKSTESLFFLNGNKVDVYGRHELKEKLSDKNEKAILLLNIDNFGNYNSIYGLKTADLILQKTIECIHTNLPQNAALYRWSGDELVVILDNYKNNQEEDLARQIQAFFLQTPIILDSFEGFITFTTGIDCGQGIELLQNADIAIKEARKHQKNTIQRYYSSFRSKETQLENLQNIKKVRYALENKMVVPYYQPIVNSKTKKIEKYECLARIIEGNNIIKAGDFLKVARISGLLPTITKSIIDLSFEQFMDNESFFSINISPEDLLDGELARYISKKIEQHKIDPARITLDIEYLRITERNQNITKQIQELKSIGCLLALDSCGSKEMGFRYLLAPYIDYITFDNAMISHLNPATSDDMEQNILINHTLKCAKEEGKKIIAKHIDSSETHNEIIKHQIELAQGNLFYEASAQLYVS